MCYTSFMDTTIRNLDDTAYRELKARAAIAGKTIGELLTDAIRAYVAAPHPLQKRGTLRDLVPEAYPEGTDRLSREIDAIVYGA